MKKNDKKNAKIHPKKPVKKAPKKPEEPKLSAEDLEIIKHIEFLLMLGLMEDFDLFEQDEKPK